MEVMHVIKRDGSKEIVSFDKVSNRLGKLVAGDGKQKPLKVDYIALAQKVCSDMYSGMHTYELDELSAQTCAGLITECRRLWNSCESSCNVKSSQKNLSFI